MRHLQPTAPSESNGNETDQTIQVKMDNECHSDSIEGTVRYPTYMNPVDIDRGWAWAVLVASFLCNCINNGINCSVGVYNAEFLTQFPDEKRSYVSLAGSLQNSISGLTGIVSGIIANKYSCRISILLGAIISALGFIGTAFSTNMSEIIATFGFVVGFGTGLVYTASTICVGQYFHRRRPIALGIATAGMALGQFMCPPLIQFLIDTYSLRGSSFIVAGLCLNNCVFGTVMKPLEEKNRYYIETTIQDNLHLPEKNSDQKRRDLNKLVLEETLTNDFFTDDSNRFCRDNMSKKSNRLDPMLNDPKDNIFSATSILSLSSMGSMTLSVSQHSVSNNQLSAIEDKEKPSYQTNIMTILDVGPLKNGAFVCLCIAVFFWASGSLLCFLHLIAYTLQHETTPPQGAILLSVIGVGNFFSRLLAGAATNDKEHVDQVTLGAGALGISALLSFSLPLFIHNYWSQVLFAALFGVYSTIIIPLLAPMTVETVGLSSLGAGFGYLMVMSGIGCGIGPPLAGYLYDLTGDYSYSFYLAGILFIGGSLMLLAIPVLKSRRHQMEEKREHRCS